MRNSRYWMGQTDWFIDDAGSREATGADAGHPIPEIERQFRMGRYPDWTASAYHLRYLTDTNNVFLSGQRSNSQIFVHGSASNGGVGQSTLYSGNIDAITALNRVAASGGQPILITSNGLPTSWTASGCLRGRMRRTSDGATGWVMKDLGSKQCRSSEWTVGGTFTAPFTPPSAAATPAGSDAIVVEQLTKIKTLRLALTGRDLVASGFGLTLESVDVGDNCINGFTSVAASFVGCILRNTGANEQNFGGGLSLYGSRFCPIPTQSLSVLPTSPFLTLVGGLIDSDGTVDSVAQLGMTRAGSFTRVMAQDVAVILLAIAGDDRGGWSLGQLGIFDCAGGRTSLTIESPGAFFFPSASSVLWGSGNAGRSIGHRAQASWYHKAGVALGTNLNIVSALGDVQFGSVRTSCPAYDDSLGLYTPNRLLSFANIVATVANGGFCQAAGLPQFVDHVSGCAIGNTNQ